MTNWIEVEDGQCVAPVNRVLLCYCPDWCESGYQVAKYRGGIFGYEDDPHGDFNAYVEKWALFMEAD